MVFGIKNFLIETRCSEIQETVIALQISKNAIKTFLPEAEKSGQTVFYIGVKQIYGVNHNVYNDHGELLGQIPPHVFCDGIKPISCAMSQRFPIYSFIAVPKGALLDIVISKLEGNKTGLELQTDSCKNTG